MEIFHRVVDFRHLSQPACPAREYLKGAAPRGLSWCSPAMRFSIAFSHLVADTPWVYVDLNSSGVRLARSSVRARWMCQSEIAASWEGVYRLWDYYFSGNIPLAFRWDVTYSLGMTTTDVIKDTKFELMVESQKPDSKKRLSIGQAIVAGATYAIYRNSLGQIVLDPVVTIPASEAWLFRNKKALASVKRGLEDSAAGRTRNLGSFAAHAKE